MKVLYLPGIDGTPDAGERLFDFLPECETLQPEYPRAHSRSLDAMSRWVLDEFLGSYDEPVALVGESYGSALAQHLVSIAPERVSSLVLLSSFLELPRPMLARIVAIGFFVLPDWLMKFPIRVIASRLILQRTSRKDRQRFHRGLNAISFSDIARRIHALKELRGLAYAKRQTPTTWIWGENDTLMNHRRVRERLHQNRPSERIMMIAQAGHVIVNAQPETLALHVRKAIGLPAKADSLPARSQ